MAQQLTTNIKVSDLFQVGIVVRNLEKSMELYQNLPGIDSWHVFEITSETNQFTYHGKPVEHSFKAAFTMVGKLMVELLEPLEGEGIYRDFLNERGEGIHHLGLRRHDSRSGLHPRTVHWLRPQGHLRRGALRGGAAKQAASLTGHASGLEATATSRSCGGRRNRRGYWVMSRADPFLIHEEECEFEGSDEPTPGRVRWRTLISGDRTPTDSLTVGVAELEPGESREFIPHKHAQAEVYYILSGEGIVTISGAEHPVRPGTAVFIPGSTAHGARNTGTQLLRLLYVFPSDSFADVKYEFPEL